MHTKINIGLPSRSPGFFLHDLAKKDVVDTFYTHKGTFVLCGRNEKNRQIRDWAVQLLEKQKTVSPQLVVEYQKQVFSLFLDGEERSVEQLDSAIQTLRCECFGEQVMEALQQERMQETCAFDAVDALTSAPKRRAVTKRFSSDLCLRRSSDAFLHAREYACLWMIC